MAHSEIAVRAWSIPSIAHPPGIRRSVCWSLLALDSRLHGRTSTQDRQVGCGRLWCRPSEARCGAMKLLVTGWRLSRPGVVPWLARAWARGGEFSARQLPGAAESGRGPDPWRPGRPAGSAACLGRHRCGVPQCRQGRRMGQLRQLSPGQCGGHAERDRGLSRHWRATVDLHLHAQRHPSRHQPGGRTRCR